MKSVAYSSNNVPTCWKESQLGSSHGNGTAKLTAPPAATYYRCTAHIGSHFRTVLFVLLCLSGVLFSARHCSLQSACYNYLSGIFICMNFREPMQMPSDMQPTCEMQFCNGKLQLCIVQNAFYSYRNISLNLLEISLKAFEKSAFCRSIYQILRENAVDTCNPLIHKCSSLACELTVVLQLWNCIFAMCKMHLKL